jgi:hypothetical protein
VRAAAGRRAAVSPVELDPGVRDSVPPVIREPDHELGLVALLAEELEEHLRAAPDADCQPELGGKAKRELAGQGDTLNRAE